LPGPYDLPPRHLVVVTPTYTDCGPNGCGSNSPMVNAFPYNGLHPGGYTNSDGVRLVLGSLARADSECDRHNTDALDLDIERTNGYSFVATAHNGSAVRCRGAELVGATFAIELDQKGRKEERILRISEMGLTDVEHPELAKTNSLPGRRTVYLITPFD